MEGKIHGKGIEYNNYNHTKYVGEFLKGKKVEKEKNILLVIINILTKIIMMNIIWYLKVNIWIITE